MSLRITADEIYVHEGGARIKTRCPKELVDDRAVAIAVQIAKLDAGDVVKVLCMDHYRQTVLWARPYIVASRRDFLRRTENLMGDIKHEETFEVRVMPLEDWLQVTADSTGWQAVDKGPVHKWWVVDPEGKPVAKGLDEETAKAVAEGRQAPPDKEAA